MAVLGTEIRAGSQKSNFSLFTFFSLLILVGCTTGLVQQRAEDEPIDLREGKPVYIWPVASPDGSRIVFVSPRSGNNDLYLMNADGSGLRNLTHNQADDGSGSYSWSPDQRRIVFASNRTGNWDIYTVAIETGRQVRLTTAPASDH